MIALRRTILHGDAGLWRGAAEFRRWHKPRLHPLTRCLRRRFRRPKTCSRPRRSTNCWRRSRSIPTSAGAGADGFDLSARGRQRDRWVKHEQEAQGRAAQTSARQANWDDSVKSLVATPSVLDMMNEKLDWTQKLGDAVLAQQTDVMDAIQRLRARAQSAREARNHQGADGFGQDRAEQASIVIEPALAGDESTSPITTPPWSTARGPIRTIRPTTSRCPTIITAAPCLPPVWHSAQASRSAPGWPAAATGVRAWAGATGSTPW